MTVLLDDLFVRAVEYAVPVTDLRVLFRRLKAQGLKIGIASSDNESSIRRTAARFEIDGWVDFIAGYDSGFGSKPEPGMLLGFCQSTGLEPRQVAMVGDNAHDLHMGQAAGAGELYGDRWERLRTIRAAVDPSGVIVANHPVQA